MKHIFILLILSYQKTLSLLIKQIIGAPVLCRFSPTCSNYAVESIKKQGVVKGSLLAFKRIIACQPFSRSTTK